MATTATPGRWTRLTVPGRVDGRMLLGVVLVAVSVIGGLLFWGSTRETVPVLVAARDLPAGHVIERDDLSVVRLKTDGSLASLTISEAELDSIVGSTLGSAVHSGELMVKPDLAQGVIIGPKEVAITIPVEADAVYPGLRQRDSVTVLATPTEAEGLTVTILDRAVVYDVSLEPGRIAIGRDSGAEDRGLTNVTLVVPEAEAESLAQAAVKWTVTLALLSAEDGGVSESER